jgi:hypothetical protein
VNIRAQERRDGFIPQVPERRGLLRRELRDVAPGPWQHGAGVLGQVAGYREPGCSRRHGCRGAAGKATADRVRSVPDGISYVPPTRRTKRAAPSASPRNTTTRTRCVTASSAVRTALCVAQEMASRTSCHRARPTCPTCESGIELEDCEFGSRDPVDDALVAQSQRPTRHDTAVDAIVGSRGA